MTREVRTSPGALAEETDREPINPDAEVQPQLPAPITPTCCERWPLCSCLRDSKILSLSNSPVGDVFERPQPWDVVALPGVSYSAMRVRDDGRVVVAIVVDDSLGVDYASITYERWQDLCLSDGARLLNGSAHGQVTRPLAR